MKLNIPETEIDKSKLETSSEYWNEVGIPSDATAVGFWEKSDFNDYKVKKLRLVAYRIHTKGFDFFYLDDSQVDWEDGVGRPAHTPLIQRPAELRLVVDQSKIDIERLEWDLEYWNEYAPEGATHYDRSDHRCMNAWMKHTDNGWYSASSKSNANEFKSWEFYNNSGSDLELIPKPVSVEWKDGVPPVGEVCEVRNAFGNPGWKRCEVIAHTTLDHTEETIVVFKQSGGIEWFLPAAFRPLMSAKDQAKYDLREEIIEAVESNGRVLDEKLKDSIKEIVSKYI